MAWLPVLKECAVIWNPNRFRDKRRVNNMSMFSGAGQEKVMTGPLPVSGDKPKLFDYGNAVPKPGDCKPAPSMDTVTDQKGK